jgi:deazaflavin-dependent oxidoreductase (nitroreductase family)
VGSLRRDRTRPDDGLSGGGAGCERTHGEYAIVASKGGAAENPEWYSNLVTHPNEVTIQDGPEPFAVTVRETQGDERAFWWDRAVAAYPPYAEYQEKTKREIPVFIATRRC